MMVLFKVSPSKLLWTLDIKWQVLTSKEITLRSVLFIRTWNLGIQFIAAMVLSCSSQYCLYFLFQNFLLYMEKKATIYVANLLYKISLSNKIKYLSNINLIEQMSTEVTLCQLNYRKYKNIPVLCVYFICFINYLLVLI